MIHPGTLPYVMAILVLAVGIYAVSCKKNLIKAIVGVIVIDYATAADPTPQALILTSIVIGLGVVALMVAMALRLHEKYGTFDLSEIRSLRG